MNIILSAKEARVEPNYNKTLTVIIDGVDKDEVMDSITVDDFIKHFGIDKVLDEIGEEECKDYFNLTEKY